MQHWPYNKLVTKAKLFGKRGQDAKARKERFRKLAWKFTVSHILTIIAAFVLLELLALALLYGIVLISSSDILTNVPKALSELSPKLAPYMLRNPVDTARLETALAELDVLKNPDKPEFSAPVPRSGENALVIVDGTGQVLAVSNPEVKEQLGKNLLETLEDEQATLLERALAGQETASSLSVSLLQPLYAASPLRSADGNIMGAAFIYQTVFSQEQLYGSSLLLVIVTLLVFLMFAAPIGALFGAFRARGLTKRLERLKLAANAWSQGDFSARVGDNSKDELGELTQQLNNMAQELQMHVQTKQQLATLEERQRIARDLHDSVKQQVFATTLQIGAARLNLDKDKTMMDKTMVQKHLSEAEKMATEARVELTRLIKALKPSELQEKNLVTALHELAESWTNQHDMKLEHHLTDIPNLSDEVQQVLYRVAQEALANVAKHSQAQRVKVRLEQDLGNIILEISDDGKGFTLSKVQHQGIGLSSMRERLEAMDGEFDIQSIPGKGTQLTASIPLGAKKS
jgi:two-component system, NarL family, sensor histidine kinase LiaS